MFLDAIQFDLTLMQLSWLTFYSVKRQVLKSFPDIINLIAPFIIT